MIDRQTEAAAKEFIARISEAYEVLDVLLFGSRARRDFRPESDADLAILLRGASGPFVATKLAMDDVAYDVLLGTGIRIQPLPIWESEWLHPDDYPNPALLRNISREGIHL
jgi:predicted nucleotidyltransferase